MSRSLELPIADPVGSSGRGDTTAKRNGLAASTAARAILLVVLLTPFAGRPRPATGQESGSSFFDLEYARGYLSVSYGKAFPVEEFLPGLELGSWAEYYAGQFGLDLGRNIGFELSTSYSEFEVRSQEDERLSELALFSLIPSVRLRLPVARDRVVPWISAGAGPAWLRVNDATPAGTGFIENLDWGARFGLRLGAGFEYYVQPAASIGAQLEYVRSTRDVILSGDTLRGVGASLGIALSVQWHVPETPPPSAFAGVEWSLADSAGVRPYFALLPGARIYLDEQFTEDSRLDSPDGGELAVTLSLGANLSRRVGVDLSGIYHEAQVWAEEKLVEYATWLVVPQLRLLFPLAGNRVTPYVMGGIGLGIGETNDARPANETAPEGGFSGQSLRPAGTLAAGTEIRLSRSLSFVLDLRYLHHRSEVDQRGQSVSVDMSAFQPSGGLRLYFR